MPFTLPPLPYSLTALEPYFDAVTMEIHYEKHHRGYVTNLNNAIAGTNADSMEIEEILKNISNYPLIIRNNAGGHYNHSLFWSILTPYDEGSTPSGKLEHALNIAFGSFTDFKKKFTSTALERFGSGWTWLIKNTAGKLEISSTPNQDNPLMNTAVSTKGFPILGLDLWEHAYYLKYQNRKQDYIEAWWNIINWNEVEKRLLQQLH
ncbi:MAG TPA: superoxide dismutase [Bacteroidia bacterium]|nr:superoxide dismutase [Bacteroidia bacterium]